MSLWLAVSVALADIPPPKGYVEDCTIEREQSAGKECVACEGYHGGREPCVALEAQGYAKECQTRGASVWTEVMCKAAAAAPAAAPTVAPTPVAPPPPSPSPAPPVAPAQPGCAHTGSGWFPAALLALLVRRRR